MQGGTEYSICLLANTPDYKVWISDLGTQDTSGNEITDQPHVGVIFKSSNNSTWVPSPTQDMKFSMKRAKFDTSAAGLVTLQNKTLPAKTLAANSLEMLDNSTALKVNHPGHGMFSILNNVTIDGVRSGAETTLNGALSSAATSITLTSGTNFDDTSGKYSRDASSNYYIKIMRLLVIPLFLEQVLVVQHGVRMVQRQYLMQMAQQYDYIKLIKSRYMILTRHTLQLLIFNKIVILLCLTPHQL